MGAPLFSADALRAMRDVHLGTLTSRAQIDAPRTSAATGQGGANIGGRTWQTVTDPATGSPASAVPCRMAPLDAATDSSQADETVNLNRWVVAFDLEGPPVTEGNRLTVSGVDALGHAWTRTVLVIGSRSPRTYSAMRTYVCQDVGPGLTAPAT